MSPELAGESAPIAVVDEAKGIEEGAKEPDPIEEARHGQRVATFVELTYTEKWVRVYAEQTLRGMTPMQALAVVEGGIDTARQMLLESAPNRAQRRAERARARKKKARPGKRSSKK